jgi:hypothetical protein
MPRPHEDLERHTPVDHRTGGPPIALAPGTWCAIEVAHLAADRIDAGVAAYETLIERARTSAAKAHAAVVFRAANGRRVIALVSLDGHERFRHLAAAWDDHHLEAEHRAVAESASLLLYRMVESAGDAQLDPASTDAYAFERVAREPARVRGLVATLAPVRGFRGVSIFGREDDAASAIVYRFEHAADVTEFRASAAAIDILGEVGASGETLDAVHPVKTFASI